MEPVRSFNIYDIIKRNADIFPDSVALVHGEKCFTFREYFNEVNALAHYLTDLGLGPGDRVAILAMNRPEYLFLYGAAAMMGAILVPLNWRLSVEELHHIMDDCQAGLLLHDASQEESVAALKIRPGFNVQLVAMEETHGNSMETGRNRGNHLHVPPRLPPRYDQDMPKGEDI
ncbi:MAG: AMP-binding protein, partial [Desulfamplus sp.]|nr:AMP-binding protein [Desulfamplus sp.]